MVDGDGLRFPDDPAAVALRAAIMRGDAAPVSARA